MFTGIITDIGYVVSVHKNGDAMFRISTNYDIDSIAMGASISCSGVCLTVMDMGRAEGKDWFMAQVSDETISCTTLKEWQIGTRTNLERALKVGDELGGHFVTGHVDDIAKIINYERSKESIIFEIQIPKGLEKYIVPKGSVTLNGTSLTVNDVSDNSFFVNIIPHTQKQTTWGSTQMGDYVNLEIDPIARYIEGASGYKQNLKLINSG